MRHIAIAVAIAVAAIIGGVACGGDDNGGKTPAATGAATSSPAPGGPTPAVTPDRTEEALAASLGRLEPLVLMQGEMPAGFEIRSHQPVGRREVAVSYAGLPTLANFFNTSELEGAWAAFFVRTAPDAGLSSIVYSFKTPDGAAKMSDAVNKLTVAEYPAATRVDPVQADKITPDAAMKVYVLPGSRTLEYTWTRGRLVGQVLLRYAGDIDNPEDVGLLVSLARKQDARMAAATP